MTQPGRHKQLWLPSATPGILGSRDSRRSHAPSQALLTLGTTERSSRSLLSLRCYPAMAGPPESGSDPEEPGAGAGVHPPGPLPPPPSTPCCGGLGVSGVSSPSVERAHGTRPPASLPHCCDSELTQQQDPGVRLASMLPSLGPSHRRHPRRPIPGDPSFRSVSHREMLPVTGWLCLQSGRWDTTFLNFPTSFLNRGGQRLRRWDLPSAQNPLVYWKSRAGPQRLP